MTDEEMNNQSGSELSPPISPPLLRRTYSSDSDTKNLDDLIYNHNHRRHHHHHQQQQQQRGYQEKTDINLLQQLLQSSPQLQRELNSFYEQQQLVNSPGNSIGGGGGGDEFQRELINRIRLRRDSIGSLTDSDFYNSDVDNINSYVMNRNGNGNVKDDVAISLTRVGRLLEMLSNLPWPRMSFTAMGICFLIATFISPKACVQNILFPAFRLVFGTLYPAYASYKAVRTKNVKEYVKWMMYWIVFAFFTCIETFTDIFLSWLPLYYEVKVIVVLWLLNPATKGSSVLYRKFVHPMLTRREQEIDEYLNQAKERGYTAVIQLGSKGVNYATNVIMQTALKGGGNLVQTIKRSYSLSDLSEPDIHRTQDEVDDLIRPQHRGLRPRTQVGRSSSSGARHSTGMYFSEIDVGAKAPVESLHYNIKSTEDISSGYSSAEPISGGLSRTSSMTSSKGLRFKAKKPEDENFSEYDENEYLMREDFISQIKSIRSQSLIEPAQTISTFSTNTPIQNTLKQNSYGLESNLGLPSTSNNKEFDNYLKDIQSINEKLSSANLEQNKSDTIGIKGKEESSRAVISAPTPPSEMNSEMQSKFEMFCQWLDKGEMGDSIVMNDDKIDIQRQISDDDFKDTISVDSNDDNSLEKFDDVFFSDAKNDTVKDNLLDKTNNAGNLENIHPSQNIVERFEENKGISETNVEELPKPTLKENISIAVDSVTKLKEHILKLHDGKSKLESPNSDMLPSESFRSATLNEENLAKSYLDSKIREEIISIPKFSENKKPIHHSKGKAPEPPVTTSITSNLTLSSSDLSKNMPLYEPPKSVLLPRPSSPTTSVTTNTTPITSRPSSPILTTTFTPISSRPSSPNTISSLQSNSLTRIPSHSRSPSPKPVVKPRRNIFRSYLPSIFRSESPKSKTDEDYPGKETKL